MNDYFEIDFLKVETAKSGDAIALRYSIGGTASIHVVDGGYLETGDELAAHIRTYYGNPSYIDNVIVTHPDGDHAAGLRTILEEFNVGALWMLRPWEYVHEIIDSFRNVTSVQYLTRVLREAYPNIAALEEIALERGIPIYEPFQGTQIGAFKVLTPSRSRYLQLIVDSDKTPAGKDEDIFAQAARSFGQKVLSAVNYVLSSWGVEVFSAEETSCENEMSVVQFAQLCNQSIMLTGDTGRDGLREVVNYAPRVGILLPGIDRFQVPHHGSRRNVSTELLDAILDPRLPSHTGAQNFTAVISSARDDPDHPRKSVVRAMIHRGGQVISTEGKTICTGQNYPTRSGWHAVPGMPYPDDQEED